MIEAQQPAPPAGPRGPAAPPEGPRPQASLALAAAVCAAATAAFVALVAAGAPDVRGSDQYWYLADTETLLAGTPKVTHYVYPAQVMAADGRPRPPFIHHDLNLYLVLPAARLLGAHAGWIATNAAASILTAALVALLAAHLAGRWAGAAAYAVYLLLPLTVWQSANALEEATITPFVAAAALLYATAGRRTFRWAGLCAVLCLASFCRPTFIPLTLLVPAAFLAQMGRPLRARNVAWAAGFLAAAVAALLADAALFPQSMPAGLHGVLINNVPGVSGWSDHHFLLSEHSLKLSWLWRKAVRGLARQVIPNRELPFYLPFNLLAVAALVLLVRHRGREELRAAGFAAAMLLLHLAQAVVHQNQFRYLLVATPPLLACGAAVAGRLLAGRRAWTRAAVLVATVAGLAGSGVPFALHLRREAFEDRKLRAALAERFAAVGAADAVVIETDRFAESILVPFVLRPRPVLILPPRRYPSLEQYTPGQYVELQRRFGGRWLFCRRDAALPALLGAGGQPVVTDWPAPFEGFGLWRLPAPPRDPPRPPRRLTGAPEGGRPGGIVGFRQGAARRGAPGEAARNPPIAAYLRPGAAR